MPTTLPLKIVIEGIGQVVQKYYQFPLRAIKTQHNKKISITFTDDSSYWEKNKKIATQNKQFIESIKEWAEYIDKKYEREKFEKLKAKLVFIATPDRTHTDIAKWWLEPRNRCQQIFIEKPIDTCLSKARDLVYLNNNSDKIIAIDHYRVRMLHFLLGHRIEEIIKNKLGEQVTDISFYLLEDGTSKKDRDPIRAEKRTKSLNEGLILDMMPHALAVIDKFFPVELMKVTELQAGKYISTNSKGAMKEAGIDWETFAHIGFKYEGDKKFTGADLIEGDIFVGKGVGGSQDRKQFGEVKLLEIVGKNGYKCTFDFRTPKHSLKADGVGWVTITSSEGEQEKIGELEDYAYGLLFARVVRRWLAQDTQLEFDLSVEKAKNFLIVMDDIRHGVKIIKDKLGKLPNYRIDYEKGAPTLEEIKEELPKFGDVISRRKALLKASQPKSGITVKRKPCKTS